MSVQGSGKSLHRICECCNRSLPRWTRRRHRKLLQEKQLESGSPPPPKRRCIAHIQAGQESSNSSTSRFRADGSSSSSDRPRFPTTPQSHAPSFEFDPSLPSLSPPQAPNLLQSSGDARTEASGRFADNLLLNLHAQTHRTTDQSDDDDSEDALEGDAVESTDAVDHETDDFWNGEDVAMEGDVDPREGVVSDWDLLAEEFIVEAEELGKFGHSLLHTP
jgi:hypothetical protein